MFVVDTADPRERAERSNAAAKAVQLLASLAEQGRDRRTDTQQQLGKLQKRQQEAALDDLETTTANLWDEREKDARFIQIESGTVRCASLNQLVYVCLFRFVVCSIVVTIMTLADTKSPTPMYRIWHFYARFCSLTKLL